MICGKQRKFNAVSAFRKRSLVVEYKKYKLDMEISYKEDIIRTDGGMNMATQYTEEFKKNAVTYWKEHPELGISKCANHLGVSKSALSTWKKLYDANEGTVPTRGRGNFESDEAKEVARLRKELRDTQDALAILKKAISILGK